MSFDFNTSSIIAKLSHFFMSFGWVKAALARQHRQAEHHKEQLEESNRLKSILRYAVLLVFLISMGWFLILRIGHYFNWPPKVYQQENVYNLTHEKVLWDVYYGDPVQCENKDCHLLADYPENKFDKKMVLPAREFPLKGYKVGQTIYLRAKVKLPDFLDKVEHIAFHTIVVFAEHYEFYLNGVLLEEGDKELMNISLPKSMIPANREIDIAIKIFPGNLSFQGLANRGDVVIGPKSDLAETVFILKDLQSNSILWFLLPKITFCVMFILFFMSLSLGYEIYSFIIFAFLSSLELFLRSSYSASMIPIDAPWNFLGMLARNFALIYFISFVHDYFRQNNTVVKKIIKYLLLMQVAVVVMSFTIIPYNPANTLVDIIALVLKPLGVLYAVYISFVTAIYLHEEMQAKTRSKFAIFLSVVFLAWFGCAVYESVNMVRDILGHNSGGIFKITWIVDLGFFFVLAALTSIETGRTITAKKVIENELKAVEERLELAKSVQEMLLPKKMHGTFTNYHYKLFYSPAEKMSGDWLSTWQVNSNEFRMIIGDVVGKGPQAALSVAVISAVLDEAKQMSMSMQECIQAINARLYGLFHGKINTTLSALCVKANGELQLYSCGAQNWLEINDGIFNILTQRHQPLGYSEKIEVQPIEKVLTKNSTYIAFTDGCLEGSRPLKKLRKEFAKFNWQNLQFDDVYNLIIDTGKVAVHDDDQTMMIFSELLKIKETATELPKAS